MNRFLNKIDLVFNFLIMQNELSSKGKAIRNIKDILFENFDEGWKKKNQKFDFSFSFRDSEVSGLRFSYNNFGEKRLFYDKVLQVFDLFGHEYSVEKLKKILDKFDSKNAIFQTTIGLEWKNCEEFPRFKIYFEEIHQEISKPNRIEMVKNISNIIGFEYKKLNIKEEDDIGAICIDFLAGQETQLKVYLMSDSIDIFYLEKIFSDKKGLSKLIKNFLETFSLESSCFYYTTKRFGRDGLNSIKVYKIYEVGGINNFSLSYNEIFKFLRRSNAKNGVKNLRELLSFALENEILFYPVISSMDLAMTGDVKTDLYLSMRP